MGACAHGRVAAACAKTRCGSGAKPGASRISLRWSRRVHASTPQGLNLKLSIYQRRVWTLGCRRTRLVRAERLPRCPPSSPSPTCARGRGARKSGKGFGRVSAWHRRIWGCDSRPAFYRRLAPELTHGTAGTLHLTNHPHNKPNNLSSTEPRYQPNNHYYYSPRLPSSLSPYLPAPRCLALCLCAWLLMSLPARVCVCPLVARASACVACLLAPCLAGLPAPVLSALPVRSLADLPRVTRRPDPSPDVRDRFTLHPDRPTASPPNSVPILPRVVASCPRVRCLSQSSLGRRASDLGHRMGPLAQFVWGTLVRFRDASPAGET